MIADLQPPYYAIVLPKFHDFRENVFKGLEKVVLPILMACLVTPATVMSATRCDADGQKTTLRGGRHTKWRKCRAQHFFRNAEFNKMRSKTDRCTLDVVFRGSYSAFS